MAAQEAYVAMQTRAATDVGRRTLQLMGQRRRL